MSSREQKVRREGWNCLVAGAVLFLLQAYLSIPQSGISATDEDTPSAFLGILRLITPLIWMLGPLLLVAGTLLVRLSSLWAVTPWDAPVAHTEPNAPLSTDSAAQFADTGERDDAWAGSAVGAADPAAASPRRVSSLTSNGGATHSPDVTPGSEWDDPERASAR